MLMRTGAGLEDIVIGGGYRPEPRRGSALVLTALVFCLPLALIVLLGWGAAVISAPAAPHVAAFDVADQAQPQEAPVPEEQAEEAEAETPPTAAEVPRPSPAPVPVPIVIAAGEPAPPVPVSAAPAAPAASPPAAPPKAQRPSGGSEGPDTWHARVLGRLNAVKTYPASARARRQQGTVLVRFTVDRRGQVLGAALEKGCGFALLDREALALPRRTSPLPPPPDDVPGERIELVVPVEFYF